MQHTSSHYQTLVTIAGQMDKLNSREQINPVLDELEFLFELLTPDAQPLCQELISTLLKRYQAAEE